MTTLVSEPKPCNSKRCSKDCRYKVYYYTPKRKEKHFKYLKDAKGWAQDKLRTMSLGLVSSEQVDKMTLNDLRENVLLSKGNETTLARANAITITISEIPLGIIELKTSLDLFFKIFLMTK